MLEKMGYKNVWEAENGVSAVTQFGKLQSESAVPVLILMDLDMPIMNGIDATIKIRSGSIKPQPFIVALTAFACEKERKNCLEAGMDYFLSKPLTKHSIEQLHIN
jgi:CheY-like chemotaxis protein